MDKKLTVNMFDIAKAAGVSQATVSRVLRQNPNVSPETRARVLDSMRALGYMSNVTSLLYPGNTQEKHFLICLCTSKDNDPSALELPYFQELIAGIRQSLERLTATSRIEILLPDANSLTMQPDDDGVFLLGVPSPELCENLRRKNIPFVIISDDLYSDKDELVTVNNYYSCRSCCRKMMESGATSFGFLVVDFHAEHLDGFLGEMVRGDIPLDKDLIHILPCTRLEAEYFAILQDWIKKGKMPQVLVTSFGPLANGIQNFLSYHHIRVPEDTRIICFSKYDYSKFPYSVIQCHPRQMGEVGVRQMLYKCEHPGCPALTTVIPNTFEEIMP